MEMQGASEGAFYKVQISDSSAEGGRCLSSDICSAADKRDLLLRRPPRMGHESMLTLYKKSVSIALF